MLAREDRSHGFGRGRSRPRGGISEGEEMRSSFVATALLAGLAGSAALARETGGSDIPARIELHAIPTQTISDTAFLRGHGNGKAVTLAGELRLPPGDGRLPLVVLMHGSSGVGANVPHWQREFNAKGIATFTIDGLTGRGLTRVGDNQATLGRLNYILDIYRSLEVLANHPRIDPEKVVMMGFSRGGQAALYASLDRFRALWNRSGIDFAAYVAFYPDCAITFREDDRVSDKPIRIFHGAADDYNPLASCQAYAERLRTAGADVAITDYAEAHHGFDNPYAPDPPASTRADQSVAGCRIVENAGGVLVNEATGHVFTYEDACVRIGPTVGYAPAAAQAATRDVAEFVRQVTGR